MFKKLIQMFKPEKWEQHTLYVHRFFNDGAVWLFPEPPVSIDSLQKQPARIVDLKAFPWLESIIPGKTVEMKILMKEL